jgi:hypothetical protein
MCCTTYSMDTSAAAAVKLYMSTPMLGLGLIDAWGEDTGSDGSDSPASKQHLIVRRSEGNINAAVEARLPPPSRAAPPLATTNSALNITPVTPISPTEPAPLPPPPLRRVLLQTQTLGEGWRRGTGRD